MRPPARGEVWLVDLGQTVGREQADVRPALIVSPDRFNRGPLVVAIPFTTTNRGSPLHVQVDPPIGGLRSVSFAMCEQLRSLSRGRLREPWGAVTDETLDEVAGRVGLLMPRGG